MGVCGLITAAWAEQPPAVRDAGISAVSAAAGAAGNGGSVRVPPSAVRSTVLEAVHRALPHMGPYHCAVALSCVTLLGWAPSRSWVQVCAVGARGNYEQTRGLKGVGLGA